MASNDPILDLLTRVTVLEIVVKRLFVSNCLENKISPEEVLAESERLKTQMESVSRGDAAAHMTACIDNLFNSVASTLRDNR